MTAEENSIGLLILATSSHRQKALKISHIHDIRRIGNSANRIRVIYTIIGTFVWRSDMLNLSDEEPATAVRTSDTSGKRRRIRKGTRSCWECKRRKIKCIFASGEDVTCLNCQRRRVPCVSQEVPEDLSLARKSNWHLGERIARVEDLLKDILDNKNNDGSNDPEGKKLAEERPSNSAASTARLTDASTSRFQGPHTPIEVNTLAMHNDMNFDG